MERHIKELVSRALDEDLGSGDLTAALIPEQAEAVASLICRENAVLCGRPWFDATFLALDSSLLIDWKVAEGADIHPDQLICVISGNARSILSGERTAINLLQTLSGTARVARRYAQALSGLKTEVLDTRKTLPGMRQAQKYAAKTGGAHNHRVGLYDGVLIKENHIRATGSIDRAVKIALETTPGDALLEVEVENITEYQVALAAGAQRILLDNFSLSDLRRAVELRPEGVKLESSGDVTLQSIRDIAETGVDYISVGALTKHVRAVDYSLQFKLNP